MSTAPNYHGIDDPEKALKYAVQHIRGDRAQIIEGIIEPVSPTWDHEAAAETIRDQIRPRARELGCVTGSGNLDLPGSSNWYVPDIAVVPAAQAKGAAALLPEDTLLIVEVTSESNRDTDRVVKRKRYAEYYAPLYLVVDRLLDEDGAEVSYQMVRGYVAARREEIRLEAGKGVVDAFVPQSHRPGSEAEVDFGDVTVKLAGELVTCYLFAFRMSYSGKAVHRVFASAGQEAFFEGHVHALTVLGGVPTGKVRYDNLRAAVAQVLGLSRRRVEAERWTAFRSHYPLTELLGAS